MKGWFYFIVSLLIAVVFVYLMVRNVELSQLLKVYETVNVFIIIFSVVIFFLGYFARIERWRLMLVHENKELTWKDCAGPLLSSMALNNVLPFRSGDLARIFAFNTRLKISLSTSIATLMVERVLDLMTLLFMLGGGVFLLRVDISKYTGINYVFYFLSICSLMILLFFPSYVQKSLLFTLSHMKFIPVKILNVILEKSNEVFNALKYTAKSRNMLALIAWSFLAWILEACVFYIVSLSLPAIQHPSAAWLAVSLGTLATIIPSTPGAVGTFDFFSTQAMVLLGNEYAAAVVFSMVVHIVIWLPVTIVGGIWLFVNRIKIVVSNGTNK